MSRYRWLIAEWPISLRLITRRLKGAVFDEYSPQGFVVDRARDDFVEGRYIEKIEYTETVVNPFGKELTFDRVEFRKTSFRMSSAPSVLELIDASRSVQPLLNRLSEATEFRATIVPIQVDVQRWAALVGERIRANAIVDSFQAEVGELGNGVSARMLFKGEADVRKAASSLLQGKMYSVNKLQLRFSGPHNGTVILSEAGTAALNVSDPEEPLVRSLRETLPLARR